MQKIILFYKFTSVNDPTMTMNWQRELCQHLRLKGRIIISNHGINGTLGGDIEEIKTYIRVMNSTNPFKKINYKWSDGMAEDFPRLTIKVRDELVTLDAEEVFDVYARGTPLKPEEWHEYIGRHPDAVIFDARNEYESDIGSFRGAVKPKIKNFREIKWEVDKLPKELPILTYCTGDIRCEYLSAYMKHRGFKAVYHLDGGIVKYGQKYHDNGYWEGKCYVFDRRMHISFSNDARDIGICYKCGSNTSNYENCLNKQCNKLILMCSDCALTRSTCSDECSLAVN